MQFHAQGQTGSALFAHYFDSLHIPQAKRHRDTSQFLGITEQTLRRYLSGHACPPPACVATLWHESDFGRATLDEHAHRGMLYARGEAQAMREQNERLRARVSQLEREIEENREAYAAGRPRLVSANASIYRVA